MPYSYCLLRYHQDAVSGEFANIGVVLWSPDAGFFDYRFCDRYERLEKFFKGFEAENLRSLMKRVSDRFDSIISEFQNPPGRLPFDEAPKHARDLATQVIPHDDGALQWSPSRGGVTNNPSFELERIFNEMILRHNPLDFVS